MSQLTEDKIAELKAAAGNAPIVSVGGVVFKRPTRAEYDRWVDDKIAGKPASTNARQLAQSCLMYPKWDDFVAILNDRPSLLLNEVLSAILDLAGVDGEDSKIEVKKL